MRNLLKLLPTLAPFTVASPYAGSPRDTSSCTSASSGDFSWTIEALTYHLSEIYTTPAHLVASASVDFKVDNPALPETVHCYASSSAYSLYFYGDITYTCDMPAGSSTYTYFTFSRITDGLTVNQTWTCPQDS